MSSGLFSVQNRVVVITGGLGQLGVQYTRALLDAGARVGVIDLEAADQTGGEEARAEGRVVHVACDVTDRSALEDALRTVTSELGPVDGLVNNAAIDTPPDAPAAENATFEDYPLERWEQVMSVNVTGTVAACQVFGGDMAARGRGAIVNVASTYGLVSPDQRVYGYRRADGDAFVKPASYSVSKGAIPSLTRYLATYWAERGVRVNTLSPGGVRRDQDPRFVDGYAARVPLGRMAREDEYNGAVIFLLSDASSYMTGANLVIDGGWTAW